MGALHRGCHATETIEKLCVLHEAGAHPTEIIGLSDAGDHLIVKQPQATVIEVGMKQRAESCGKLSTVLMPSIAIRGELRIFWHDSRAWLLGDLHRGNIMGDADNESTIIDALIGSIPRPFVQQFNEVAAAIRESQNRREGTEDGQLSFL